MAKDPTRQKKADNEVTTAKIKTRVYNRLVSLRTIGESLSDVIERLLPKKREGKK